MSSTLTSTEIRTLSKVVRRDDKTQRLVRTSSLEKIRRFNTYICSQQYYILPALLAWLRSSHGVLHSSTEKTIFFFRSLVFTNVLYKLYSQSDSIVALLSKRWCRLLALRIAVYATALTLAAELGACFYLLAKTHVPNGLLFLIVCWFYIIYLNLRSLCFSSEKRNDRKKRN